MILLAPTITKIPANSDDAVVVSASHGGAYPGYLAATSGIRAIILNDAGVGRDQAGIASLALCQAIDMAAATVAAQSARIGDADDMMANGIISYCNRAASDAGVQPGDLCRDAAQSLRSAITPSQQPPAYSEARYEYGRNQFQVDIVCLDSVSLVLEDDAGRIVVTGSHGGVVGGNPALAIRVPAVAAFYNDAGVGKHEAGITRLSALHERGIIAATVFAESARIGDGKNTYEDGVISHVNECAAIAGLAPGMPLRSACELVVRD